MSTTGDMQTEMEGPQSDSESSEEGQFEDSILEHHHDNQTDDLNQYANEEVKTRAKPPLVCEGAVGGQAEQTTGNTNGVNGGTGPPTHDVRRSQRRSEKTEKGLEYHYEIAERKAKSTLRRMERLEAEVEQYMHKQDSLDIVTEMFNGWLSEYDQFKEIRFDLLRYWPKSRSEPKPSFAGMDEQFGRFDGRVQAWVFEKRFPSTKETLDDFVKPTDSVSQVSRRSNRSKLSRASSAQLRDDERLAELMAEKMQLERKAAIKEEINKVRQQEEIEREKLRQQEDKLRQQEEKNRIKLEQLEENQKLQNEIELIQARNEVRRQAEERASMSGRRSAASSRHNTRQQAQATSPMETPQIGRQPTTTRGTTPRFSTPARNSEVGREVVNEDEPGEDTADSESNRDNFSHSRTSQNNPESASPSTVPMEALVRRMNIPRSQVTKFDGDPMIYRRFINSFKSKIEAVTDTNLDRMEYLLDFTEGEAHSIIVGYSHLPPDEGYPMALEQLEKEYGDVHIIVRAFVDKAMSWPTIKNNDAKALKGFLHFLTQCEHAVRTTPGILALQYPDNMTRLCLKLPYTLQQEWMSLASNKRQNGEDVKFQHLVNLVRKKANAWNDPLYRIDRSNIPQAVGNNTQRGSSKQNRTERSFATSEVSEQRKGKKGKKGSSTPTSKQSKAQEKPCLYCKDANHPFELCERLIAANQEETVKFLKTFGVCFGCLRSGHLSRDCKQKAKCARCEGKHPTILHRDRQPTSNATSNDTKDTTQNTDGAAAHCVTTHEEPQIHMGTGDAENEDDEGECLMTVIPVKVRARDADRMIETYAFLDTGSSLSFCSENLKRQLGATGRKTQITLNTMGNRYTMDTFIVTGLEVYNLDCTYKTKLKKVYTKGEIPISENCIPRETDIHRWPHLRGVNLPTINAEIGLLLGNRVPDAYVPLQTILGPPEAPFVTKTRLGWVAWNVVRHTSERDYKYKSPVNTADLIAVEETDELKKLERLVRQTINLDFPERTVDDKKENSQEDKKFIQEMSTSLKFVNNHYEMKLPFRNKEVRLPNNQRYALQRFKGLERKFRGNSKFHADYQKFMADIIEKGYAVEIPAEEIDRDDGKVWYIPHHGVYHPKKPEKIRVVFDCSAKFHGVSLNDLLLQGPDLTNNLLGVLLRFRQEPIALMADIEAMFHQVKVQKEDTDCLRFYWWPDGNMNSQPRVYKMMVHLFGAISSPSCANTALHKTADDNSGKFDAEVTNTIKRNFYVDDCLKSVDSVQKAINLTRNLTAACQNRGFHLTKWVSNSREVLEAIPTEEKAKEIKNLELDYDSLPVERALGVSWSVESDNLVFRINIKDQPATRRGILSIISSVYDPIGLAAPFILPARMILQELCRRGIGWDHKISGNPLNQWQQWLSDLPKIEALSVKRCYKPAGFGEVKTTEIHHFSDASEKGYGIASYIRLINDKGRVHCALLIGKSRVTPLKKISIPRLELTAATITVKMNRILKNELDLNIDKVYFWTDSMTVIRYHANETTRFHTFVANRINTIREGSELDQWKYVDTANNPADDASRGLAMNQSMKIKRWLEGPPFLWKPESEWPRQTLSKTISEDDIEVKKQVPVNTAVVEESVTVMDRLLARYPSWHRLRKAAGWIIYAREVLRKRCILRKQTEKALEIEEPDEEKRKKLANEKMRKLKTAPMTKLGKNLTMTYEILQQAEDSIIRYVQQRHFPEEMAALHKDREVKKSSPLYKLDPILVDGILRVGGRLSRASIPEYTKHPIVLPKNTPISTIILQDIHQSVGHLGRNSMISKLRQKYWILCAATAARSIIAKCVICRRHRAKTGDQKMADLPIDRVTPDEAPFNRTGVDYFGPIEVKRGRVTVKRYGAIFTCMTTRAVHLEVAHSLDTDSCINALRRFIARRGQVKLIRSDNGTNFVGANRELREEIKKWNQSKIADALNQHGIKWEFNPPAGSHFGGVWERHIRTIRKILFSLSKEQNIRMNDEALQTLFCEVEAIINSRPITALSDDPNDLEALTPNHLLMLQPKQAPPPGLFEKDDNYARRRWRHIQYLADTFWKRWVKEYLPLLQERQKWLKPRRNLTVGDVVLIVDNTTTRNSWSMGRIISVLKDKKGLVRIASVQTKTSTLQRPVDKLCVLLEADTPEQPEKEDYS